jgi:hypothetical protein
LQKLTPGKTAFKELVAENFDSVERATPKLNGKHTQDITKKSYRAYKIFLQEAVLSSIPHGNYN